MKYKWLLFDADGTLFDYDKAEAKALAGTFEQLGHKFKPEFAEQYRFINALMWRAFEEGRVTQEQLRIERFEKFFELTSIQSDPVIFGMRYLENLSLHSDLIDGAEEVVRRLADRAGLMLITNGLKDVQRPRFERSAIREYFADFIISEEVGAAKPNEKIFEIAFEKMSHPDRNAVLIVGDNLSSDIAGGNNYRIDTCWYNPAGLPRGEDVHISHEIRSLPQLLDIVDN